MQRNVYLESTPLNEALRKWLEKCTSEGFFKPLPAETVRITDSLGRVTAAAVIANISSPFYHSSAMDGYAVKFSDTFGASERTPRCLSIGNQALPVDTGDPIPDGFNAVIMIEDVQIHKKQEPSFDGPEVSDSDHRSRGDMQGGECIEIIAPATPWQHIRVIGDDIVATELVVSESHKIRPVEIGAMLASGHTDVLVRKRPRVVIVPTGSEIVEPGSELKKGDIIEFNSRILSGLVSEWGGDPVRLDIAPDDLDQIKRSIMRAVDAGDIVIVHAGSSAGSEDYTAAAIREMGEIILHGIGIKPGKPLILGWVRGKPVIGIPGYPVSAYITFTLFVKPLVYKLQGLECEEPDTMNAILSRQVASGLGQEEFVRVKIGKVGERYIATPITRGAGVLMSLVRADGFVRVPSMSEGIGSGTEVRVELLRSKHDIENTIVCIGSHDNALDLLANALKKRYPKFSLSSAHVGSMGGLVALKRGEAHIAGTHLLDEETGEYNIAFVQRLLPGRKILLMNLVYREQGLLVPRGNPKNIRGFEDLTRNDVIFVNRQAGAGTRLLTDKNLRELEIRPERVKGYEREEYTHMGVASAVLTGVADTGLAILASARALNLEFIPVAKERYDLAIPEEYLDSEMMNCLVTIIREDREFREMVVSLGGYDISEMGTVVYRP
jgi:putative molybdopterin biosynthesis protein